MTIDTIVTVCQLLYPGFWKMSSLRMQCLLGALFCNACSQAVPPRAQSNRLAFDEQASSRCPSCRQGSAPAVQGPKWSRTSVQVRSFKAERQCVGPSDATVQSHRRSSPDWRLENSLAAGFSPHRSHCWVRCKGTRPSKRPYAIAHSAVAALDRAFTSAIMTASGQGGNR